MAGRRPVERTGGRHRRRRAQVRQVIPRPSTSLSRWLQECPACATFAPPQAAQCCCLPPRTPVTSCATATRASPVPPGPRSRPSTSPSSTSRPSASTTATIASALAKPCSASHLVSSSWTLWCVCTVSTRTPSPRSPPSSDSCATCSAAPGLNDMEVELADNGGGLALRLRQVETTQDGSRHNTPERRILRTLAEAEAPLSQRQIRERAATLPKAVDDESRQRSDGRDGRTRERRDPRRRAGPGKKRMSDDSTG